MIRPSPQGYVVHASISHSKLSNMYLWFGHGLEKLRYLGLLCSELPRSLARQAILQARGDHEASRVMGCLGSLRREVGPWHTALQALAHFDAENARACPEGFAVTILALYGAGQTVGTKFGQRKKDIKHLPDRSI